MFESHFHRFFAKEVAKSTQLSEWSCRFGDFAYGFQREKRPGDQSFCGIADRVCRL